MIFLYADQSLYIVLKGYKLRVTQNQETIKPTTKITQHGVFIIRVYQLVYRIHRRVCCYSNGESPCHPSFYKEQKPSHSQHVLGYKLNRGGHVGWSPIRGLCSIWSPTEMSPYKIEFISGSSFFIVVYSSFLSSCLPDKHCCDFCRAISRHVSSI